MWIILFLVGAYYIGTFVSKYKLKNIKDTEENKE
jgi:hypothetical protein